MKYVYILDTNHDGLLAVFTNKKRAIREAVEYCGEDCRQEIRQIEENTNGHVSAEFYGKDNYASIESIMLTTGTGE